MKVACYLRTGSSTRERNRQRAEILRWLKQNEIEPAAVQWYSDKALARTNTRSELDRLEKDIADGKVGTVALWKLSHLAERFQEVAATLSSWCERGVKVIVVAEQIEVSGAIGREVSALLRGLLKTELEYRRGRQRTGIKEARRRGVYLGRKKGTTKGKPQEALALKGKGLTVAEIAKTLGVSERTVFRYLGSSSEPK